MMLYRRLGSSGLSTSVLTLGFWHNFGGDCLGDACRTMMATALDAGITSFDLANNYGPPPGSAETHFGETFAKHFHAYRDEVIIASKAGHLMWNGPYGDGGSRKHILASADQSLRRLQLDYVDIFYHHRPDPTVPMEESLGALVTLVHQGKALYAGISKYSPADTARAIDFFSAERIPFVVHQSRYSLFCRDIESGLLPLCKERGLGVAAFSILAQGLLSERYLHGIPEDSRMGRGSVFLTPAALTPQALTRIRALNDFAQQRGYTLPALALKWVLRDPVVSTAIIGASKPEQISAHVAALTAPDLSPEDLATIDSLLTKE